MNVYVAGRDWHIVPGFDAPPGFHASERVWYIGAAEHPGETFVSEPYLDANTGAMCFSISTCLSDEETVVCMDLNFTKAQDSIEKMTKGTDSTAMIVTEGGLIVGYSDMSLVGASATERLPEYQDILDRVTTTASHDSFRVTIAGTPSIIFSSQTGTGWYLIVKLQIIILKSTEYTSH